MHPNVNSDDSYDFHFLTYTCIFLQRACYLIWGEKATNITLPKILVFEDFSL